MIKIYNTLTKTKQELIPMKKGKIKMFVCGPTVYDYSHIGHGRTYIAFDIIANYLRYQGFEVLYLQNITDIDDRIIVRANERGISAKALSQKFSAEHLKDMKTLGIDSVNKYAKATLYIPEIISQVKRLIKKGYGYEIANDGVYFDIKKFKEYGKLSGRTALQAEDSVSRIDDSIAKHNKGDFALWKLSKPGEPKWKSPWGWGRPGWHIEDTAITEKYFGQQYDLHGGSRDIIFPHHEAEISQMEAISGKVPFVRYWMHTGFLTVSKEKMSKSVGNFVTIREFLEKNSARILRFLVTKNHYRTPLDFSDDVIKQADIELEKINEFLERINDTFLQDRRNSSTEEKTSDLIKETRIKILESMNDDFNTPVVIASLFEFISKTNSLIDKQEVSKTDIKNIKKFLKELDTIFGFIIKGYIANLIPEEIKKLAEVRQIERVNGNWGKADEIRKKIELSGWTVKDEVSGFKLRKIK